MDNNEYTNTNEPTQEYTKDEIMAAIHRANELMRDVIKKQDNATLNLFYGLYRSMLTLIDGVRNEGEFCVDTLKRIIAERNELQYDTCKACGKEIDNGIECSCQAQLFCPECYKEHKKTCSHHLSYKKKYEVACQERDAALAMWAELKEANRWRSMDSAPRDGTWIDAGYKRNWIIVVRFKNNYWQDGNGNTRNITHWRPRPTPPTDEELKEMEDLKLIMSSKKK